MNRIKTAVVILNWNGQKYLEKFLPTVVKYSCASDIEIYVADNGSTDNSVTFLKTNFETVKLILFDKNYGFADGYNKALNQIDAKYFILLNSDVEVTENWINPIIELFEKDENVAAYMPKLLNYNQKDEFEYAGAAGGFIDKYGYPFCRGRILQTLEKDENQYNTSSEIFWATGACMFVRADIYKKLDGLDARFFAHMEEIDLCWRIKNNGHKIMYSNLVTVYHVGGGTLPNNNPFKLYLNYRNNLLLLYKNLPTQKLFSTIFLRLILDGISSSIYLLTFKFGYFAAVFKAHINFYKMIKYYKNFRKTNKQTNKINYNEVYQKSIVFAYFIKKIKKFNNIKF